MSSYSINRADSSGIQASDQATAIRLDNGATLNQTTLDGGAISAAFTFGGRALDTAGKLQGDALSATRQVALSTSQELANAYRDARGATSGNAVLAVVVVIVLAAAALLIKGR